MHGTISQQKIDTIQLNITFKRTQKKRHKRRQKILYGHHDTLYGESLSLIDETNLEHSSIVNQMMERGEDDFDEYMEKNKEKLQNMIDVLQLYAKKGTK